jgi:hypothetical protein
VWWLLVAACSVRQAAPIDALQPIDAVVPDAPICTTCDPNVGLCAPAPICSPLAPCTIGSNEITLPDCMTTASGRPVYDDAPALMWNDAVTGEQRAACVFHPTGASPASLRPLVMFFHNPDGSADTVYNATSLRTKATSFVLSGDPTRPGFVLVADQGRNLHAVNGTSARRARTPTSATPIC